MPKRSNNRRRGKTRRGPSAVSLGRQVKTIKTQLVGRMTLFSVSTNSSGLVVEAQTFFNPVTIGDRPGSVAAAFNRYRVIALRFIWRSRCPSDVGGKMYLGVSDDVVLSPTTANQILNFRTSAEVDIWKDSSIVYTPVDPRWAYLRPESSNSDVRFTNFGTFCLIGDGTALSILSAPATAGNAVISPLASALVGTVDLEYHFVYDGATDDAD